MKTAGTMTLLNKFDTEVSPSHELIALANAASFENTHFHETLTTFAQGWRDPTELQAELEFVAPQVEVQRRFEFRKFASANDFMIDSDDERSVGADFKRVKFDAEIVQSKTVNRGLTIFLDMDEVVGMPDYRERYLAYLLRRTRRNDLATAVALLLASAANTGKTWNTTSDPDADLMDLVDASGDELGFSPNRIYGGANAWAKRVKAFRAQETAGALASSGMTPQQVADWLGIDRIWISRTRYQATATTKAKITGAQLVAFYAESAQIPEDPSNIKRFVSRCADGSMERVYVRQVSEKIEALTVERYVRTVAVSTLGLKKYTIS